MANSKLRLPSLKGVGEIDGGRNGYLFKQGGTKAENAEVGSRPQRVPWPGKIEEIDKLVQLVLD